MKLIVRTTTDKVKELTPRDIRNFIGSIVDAKYKDLAMWHEKRYPELIYIKPFAKGFEILNYTNNIELMEHIEEKLLEHKDIAIRGIKTKISKVWTKPEQFIFPYRDLCVYKTRTPIVISVNPVEFGISYFAKDDKEKLFSYVKSRIVKSVKLQAKQYFDVEVDMEDFQIKVLKYEHFQIKYKDNELYPAVFMEFMSNYKLPRFVGYKIGLGWGEIYEPSSQNFR